MIYLPVPDLSRRMGRPVLLAVTPFSGDDGGPEAPEGSVVITTRWPSARLLLAMPEAFPGAPCWADLDPDARWGAMLRWEAWVDRLLLAVIQAPAVTLADVRGLGRARDQMTSALLRAWSWSPELECPACGGAEVRQPEPGLYVCRCGEPVTPAWPRLPGPALQDGLRTMCRLTRQRPSELLDGPLPPFIFDFRLLATPEAERRMMRRQLQAEMEAGEGDG